MSRVITFRGYGVGAGEIFIIVDRITHFESVQYNGISGVRIELDTGKTVTVDSYCHDVKKQIELALGVEA